MAAILQRRDSKEKPHNPVVPPPETARRGFLRSNRRKNPVKSLDKKLKTIAAGKYKPKDFILADAKDPDYAFATISDLTAAF